LTDERDKDDLRKEACSDHQEADQEVYAVRRAEASYGWAELTPK
jgi:hypothetical protein